MTKNKITDSNSQTQTKKKKRKWPIIVFLLFLAILIAISCYAVYYFSKYSKNTDKNAVKNTALSTVTAKDDCIFIDGPSTTSVLVFYPGANIESEAYCSLLKPVADSGTDVIIAKPIFHFQLFQPNQAEDYMKQYNYAKWSIGGHSLGGAMAGQFCESHPNKCSSIINVAAFTDKNTTNSTKSALTIGASNDQIVTIQEIDNHAKNLPADSIKYIVQGGNHAQFGNYGTQEGDGIATISASQQQQIASNQIIQFFASH